ncbi:hypothetical protein Gotur_008096 [Gossypium turneri]
MIHSKKRSQMRILDQRGADAHRVDSTRTSIRALSTKMRVTVQVIDNIVITINKVMDEELWPQINELIHSRKWMENNVEFREYNVQLEVDFSLFPLILYKRAREMIEIMDYKEPGPNANPRTSSVLLGSTTLVL